MEGVTHGTTDDGKLPLCPYREPEDRVTRDRSKVDCGVCRAIIEGKLDRGEEFDRRAAALAGPGWKGGGQ